MCISYFRIGVFENILVELMLEMFRYRFLYYTGLLLIAFLPELSFGQSLRVGKDTTLVMKQDTLIFEPNFLVPHSVFLQSQNSSIQWLPNKKCFVATSPEDLGVGFSVSYQVLNFEVWNSPPRYTAANSLDTILQDTVRLVDLASSNTTSPQQFSQLNKSGMFARGVQVGSQQSMTVQSSLNLSLDGKLTDKIRVKAAISDYTVPLQANGASAQLNELDKVFIQLYSDRHSVTAGDFLLRDSTSFLRLRKKWQGLLYQGNMPTKKGTLLQSTALAIARGVFHRVQFRGIEGNQGPYRLLGKNGELAITILSGSERVYINGDLMQRGANADYTIDYNTSELSFTLQRPILRASRIIVEYEYTNQKFNRYSVFNKTEWKGKNAEFALHYVNTFDDKNAPLLREFTTDELEQLQQAGNSLDNTTSNSAIPTDFSVHEVLYRQTDTVVVGQTHESIFVRSYSGNVQNYRVSFRLVGEQKGDYVLTNSAENGRVFSWVAPVAGTPQGNYSPTQSLDAAQRHQMLVGKIGAWNNRLKAEVVVSEKDPNTYSTLDNDKNIGFAQKILFGDSLALRDSANFLKYEISYEHTDSQFVPYEVFREVEFSRNWGLPQNQTQFAGHIGQATLLWKKNASQLFVQPAYLHSDTGQVKAFRSVVNYHYRTAKWHVRSESNFAQNQSPSNTVSFVKSINQVQRRYKNWEWGGFLKYKMLENSNELENDPSFQFVDYHANIGWLGTKKQHVSLQVGQRYDFLNAEGVFFLDEQTDKASITGLWKNKHNHMRGQVNMRRIRKIATSPDVIPDEKYRLSSRLQYDWSCWKSSLRASFFHESHFALEAGREFQFVKVADGQGQYKWVDYNENGIQEKDEFEQAVFLDEGNYMRVWYPSSEYVEVRQNKMRAHITFRPRLKKKKGLRKILNQSLWQVNYRNTTKYENLPWYEIYTLPTDTANLLAANGKLQARYKWNNRKTGWLLELNYRNLHQLISLLNGQDTKVQNNYTLKLNKRWRLVQWNNTVSQLLYTSKSDAFENRNFEIETQQVKSELVWKGFLRSKLSGFYRYAKKNTENHQLILEIHHTGIGLDWKLPKALLLKSELGYIYNQFNSVANTPVATQMLEGFLPGNNFLARAQFNRKFGKFLELNLNYEARLNEGSTPIQTGQLQLKAIF